LRLGRSGHADRPVRPRMRGRRRCRGPVDGRDGRAPPARPPLITATRPAAGGDLWHSRLMRNYRFRHHREAHLSGRAGWLRAMVLGSNDAIVSTASLMLGVAASSASRQSVLVAGVAGLVAGSMSMAAGEFVSVSSQRDAEDADIERERRELGAEPQAELSELAKIYEKRGLDSELAAKVAAQLTAHDVLAAHMRDELGIDK